MKKGLLIILIASSLSNIYAQNCSQKELKNIKKHLTKIYAAGLKKDSVKLTKLIYPIKSKKGKDYRKEIVIKILENDTRSVRDLAYSDTAFKLIIDSLYVNFKPVSEKLYTKLIRPPEYGILKEMKKEDILVFDHLNVHIILIRYKNKLQLLFWENMNKLLKK